MLKGETLTPSLPDDIILDILLRLPVSSVTRFNSVCKYWHSLIRSRRFIEMHLRRGLQTDDRLCLLASLHPRGFSINCRYINKSLGFVGKKKVVWLAPSSSHTLSSLFLPPHYSRCCDSSHGPIFMGSCNGLLCFNLLCKMTLKFQTFMWNPATGAFRFMSEDDVAAGDVCDETPPEFKFTGYTCGFGFGYDSSVDDYKIVRLVKYADHESFVRVDLLTVGSHKLRRFQLPARGFFWSKVGVLLQGSLHWLMCGRGSEYYILRFNLETEKLDELIVQIPHPSDKEEAYYTSRISFVKDLSIVDGKLYVIAVYLKNDRKYKDDYEVWVMEEYGWETSWTKRFSLLYDHFLFRSRYISGRPLYITRDGGVLFGGVLFGGTFGGPWFIFDPKEKTCRRISFPYIWTKEIADSRLLYVESLVSPFHIPNPNWRFEE